MQNDNLLRRELRCLWHERAYRASSSLDDDHKTLTQYVEILTQNAAFPTGFPSEHFGKCSIKHIPDRMLRQTWSVKRTREEK